MGQSQKTDDNKLYRSFLEAALPYLARKVEKPPVDCSSLIEAERCAIAARKSWMERDREVKLSDLGDSQDSYDRKAFAAEFRKSKYP